MSVKRLILDTGQVDQDRIIGTGSIVLNNRATLDSNIIAGTGYDSSLGYNSNITFYDGSSIIYDYAAAGLNGLQAIAQSLPKVVVIASANLNGLNASVQSTPQVIVTASANLNGLSALGQSQNKVLAIGSINLGSIDSQSEAIVTHLVSALSNFESAISQAFATINHLSLANAELKTLQATATSSVKQLPIAQATLGSLTTIAQAIVTPVTPPTPEPGGHGGIPNYRKKKPQFIEYVEEPIVPKPITQIFASSANRLSGFSAKAESNIQWSILEDDAEILLLL